MLRKADDTSETITGYFRGRPDPLNTVRENDPFGLVLYLRAAAQIDGIARLRPAPS
jgi:hypothetical protein